MKTPPFLLIGCPVLVVICAVVYFLTFPKLHQTPFHAALVQAETVAPSGGHMREILAQLQLSDAQQQQIDQIRKTISDRTQRRQAIFNVLTPEQRAKWKQLRDQQQQGTVTVPSTNTP